MNSHGHWVGSRGGGPARLLSSNFLLIDIQPVVALVTPLISGPVDAYQDLAGRLQRGRAKIKTTKDAKTSGEPNKSVESESEDKDDEDDVAAQELGMTAEVIG